MGTGQMALGWKGDFSLYTFLYFLIFESYECVTDPKTNLMFKNKRAEAGNTTMYSPSQFYGKITG